MRVEDKVPAAPSTALPHLAIPSGRVVQDPYVQAGRRRNRASGDPFLRRRLALLFRKDVMAEEILERSLTIPEFCKLEHISIPTYIKLRNLGRGPREMHHGAARRISPEARRDWHREQENLTGEQAEAQAEVDERVRKRARLHGQKAVASPNHISKKRAAR